MFSKVVVIKIFLILSIFSLTAAAQLQNYIDHLNNLNPQLDDIMAEPQNYHRHEIATCVHETTTTAQTIKTATDRINPKIYEDIFDLLAKEIRSTQIAPSDIILDLLAYHELPITEVNKAKFMITIFSQLASFYELRTHYSLSDCENLAEEIMDDLDDTAQEIKENSIITQKADEKKSYFKKKYLLALLFLLALSIGIMFTIKIYNTIKNYEHSEKIKEMMLEKISQRLNQQTKQQEKELASLNEKVTGLQQDCQKNMQALETNTKALNDYKVAHSSILTNLMKLGERIATEENTPQAKSNGFFEKYFPAFNFDFLNFDFVGKAATATTTVLGVLKAFQEVFTTGKSSSSDADLFVRLNKLNNPSSSRNSPFAVFND